MAGTQWARHGATRDKVERITRAYCKILTTCEGGEKLWKAGGLRFAYREYHFGCGVKNSLRGGEWREEGQLGS